MRLADATSIHCYSCGVDWELERGEYFYRCCGECFHVWRTEDELRDHDFDEMLRFTKDETAIRRGGRRAAEDIHCCPCCVHDF
jgi:hypothetical protein